MVHIDNLINVNIEEILGGYRLRWGESEIVADIDIRVPTTLQRPWLLIYNPRLLYCDAASTI